MNSFDRENGSVFSFPDGHLMPSELPVVAPKFSGVLSGPMWEKVDKLDSGFEDTFDWSVYDKLHAKFGEEQPRGGVVFKASLKLANMHDSCSKCHYSFEIDTYGRGCVHNCHYCYAKDSLTKHGAWNRPHPFPFDLAEIRKIFHTVFETDKKSKWRPILEQRIPLRIGSMSDSFMWMDQKFGVTHELLRILSYYDYPHIIFTRSDLISSEKYLSVLRPDLTSVQFSISSNNEAFTRKAEPGAPSIKRRFASLKVLNEAGFRTAVRINPLFPTFPDGYFTDPESIKARFGSYDNVPKFDFFDIDQLDQFVNDIKESKTATILAGFVRLTPYTINRMRDVSGTDLRVFFRPENFNTGIRGNTDKNYSDAEIAYYYKKIRTSAVASGLRFSTCYIGNGLKDYFQYQNLWSNKSDCCDVVGKIAAFKKTCQEIPWEERAKHSANKMFIDRAMKEEAYYSKIASKDALANTTTTFESLSTVIPKSMMRAKFEESAKLENP